MATTEGGPPGRGGGETEREQGAAEGARAAVDREMVKAALTEILGEIPAFAEFARRRAPPAPPRVASGPADAGTSGSADPPAESKKD